MTEFLLGNRERIAVAAESSYGGGADISSNGWVIGTNAVMTPSFNQGWQKILSAEADTRAAEGYQVGPLQLPYTLEFNPVDWRFLQFLFDVSTSGSGPYTHTLTLGDTISTFENEWVHYKSTTPHVINLLGSFVKNLSINFQKATGEGQEGFIKCNAECNCKEATGSSSYSSVSSIDKNPYMFYETKLTIGGRPCRFFTVEVNSGTINIDNGVNEEDSRYCNTSLARKLGEPIPKEFMISGTFNLNVPDSTYYDYWLNGDTISGTNKIEFIKIDGEKSLSIELTGLRFNSPGEGSTDLGNVKTIDISWRATTIGTVEAIDNISSW